MKKPYSILIILRKDKIGVDGKCPLNVQVRLNSKVIKLPTKQKIYPEQWNSKTRTCIGKGYGELNVFLKDITLKLEKFCLNKINNNQPLTIDMIKEYYNGVNLNCFYTVFDKMLAIKSKKIKEPTLYKYNLLRKYLKEFKKRIDVAEINLMFIEDFETFLRKKNDGIHGIANHHKNLDAIINLAIKHKLMIDNPYINKEYKEKSECLVFLTPDELESFIKIKVNPNSGIRLTKDRFVFASITGLRYCDINTLKMENIDFKTKFITKKQVKTGKPVKIPLSTRAFVMAKQYGKGKDKDELLFPTVTNQNDNTRLKILAEAIELNKNLTFHVSRHTFGTMMVNYYNVPITIVKEMMGHTDISITAKYANVNTDMMKEAMKNKFKF
ncbi:site-specific integrase [Chryseobacterium bernardetii]|uniref:site-specific integrase n=1 Tax=Chryseobacterium bernardetii TaxID=1241978 RepID=UPI001625CA3A|nr:site-specific integrase [Chryseobacterium bernardetii]